jgi:thiamine-phosphate pyrophosphorylase
VIVNDRVDVALACGADGVHLRGDSIPAVAARRLAPPGFLIGCSVHSVKAAIDAAGADYLIAGTVWPTSSKPEHHPLLGLEAFASIVTAVSVPVLAIGGVTAGRVTDVALAGGAGVAAIGLFTGEAMGDDCRAVPLTQTISTIRQRFDTSRTRS